MSVQEISFRRKFGRGMVVNGLNRVNPCKRIASPILHVTFFLFECAPRRRRYDMLDLVRDRGESAWLRRFSVPDELLEPAEEMEGAGASKEDLRASSLRLREGTGKKWTESSGLWCSNWNSRTASIES